MVGAGGTGEESVSVSVCPYAMTDAYLSQFSSGKVKMGRISASAGLFPPIAIPVR